MAAHVTPVFAYAASGAEATLLQSWLAAVGFTLQIYFDFSGYSDMACGAALFFGVRLPINFDSPLKATNIIDFWLRWHITLTRFLTAYIYNPMALALTRARAARRLPMLRARDSHPLAFLHVLAFPTITTMVLSGIWHGAGYTFILWGLLHGVYLVVTHLWRQYGPRPAPTDAAGSRGRPRRLAGFALTFLAVVAAMVLFRAPDLASAGNILGGMVGLHGIGLPGARFGDRGDAPPRRRGLGATSSPPPPPPCWRFSRSRCSCRTRCRSSRPTSRCSTPRSARRRCRGCCRRCCAARCSGARPSPGWCSSPPSPRCR